MIETKELQRLLKRTDLNGVEKTLIRNHLILDCLHCQAELDKEKKLQNIVDMVENAKETYAWVLAFSKDEYIIRLRKEEFFSRLRVKQDYLAEVGELA